MGTGRGVPSTWGLLHPVTPWRAYWWCEHAIHQQRENRDQQYALDEERCVVRGESGEDRLTETTGRSHAPTVAALTLTRITFFTAPTAHEADRAVAGGPDHLRLCRKPILDSRATPAVGVIRTDTLRGSVDVAPVESSGCRRLPGSAECSPAWPLSLRLNLGRLSS